MAPEKQMAQGRIISEGTELSLVDDAAELSDVVKFRDIIAVIPARNSSTTAKFELLSMSTEPKGSEKDVQGIRSLLFDELPQLLLEKFHLAQNPPHLTVPRNSDGKPNLHVVVSLLSGTQQAEAFFGAVVEPLLLAIGLDKGDFEVHRTSSNQSIVDLTTTVLVPHANAGVAQTVLLLAGDGGIVDMINTLLQSPQTEHFVKPSIGVVVLGTGNALANSSGLNDDSTQGLSSILRGTPRNLPTFKTRFSPGSCFLVDEARRTEALSVDSTQAGVVYGAVVCSWALHASLVADSDTSEYRRYGSERFQMAAKELLSPSDGSQPHSYHGKVTMYQTSPAGGEIEVDLDRREHMYILATLVSNLERTFRVSPHSKPLDGQLRLLHFGPLPSSEVMRILGMAFAGGQHIHEAVVGYEDVRGLRIQFEEPDERWRRICIDGKIVRIGHGGWMEVRKELREVANLITANS